MTDEEYVRSKWEFVTRTDRSGEVTVSLWASCGTLWKAVPEREWAIWTHLRIFTEQREREIAELEEEIRFAEVNVILRSMDGPKKAAMRTLARLEAMLADAKKGMKL